MGENKRGLSPIIATSLLILLAMVLAVIIFFWARSVISEKVQKDLGGGERNIDDACKNVQFVADVTSASGSTTISIENTGNVPIYGVELIKNDEGSKRIIGNVSFAPKLTAVKSGESSPTPNPFVIPSTLATKTNVLVVPILLGKIGQSEREYICSEDYGVSAEVA